MIIGADPGVHGAIALLFDNGSYAGVWDIPTRTMIVNDSKRNEVDIFALEAGMESWRIAYEGHQFKTCVEGQFMPRESKDPYAIGRLCEIRGILCSVIERKFAAPSTVSAATWKKRYKLPKDKKATLDVARRLFPEAPLNLRKHDGRADALMIARWLYEFGG